MSIKFKFAILIATSLVILSGGVGVFSWFQVNNYTKDSQWQSMNNAVLLTSLDIENQYKSLLRWRTTVAKNIRSVLGRQLTTIATFSQSVAEEDIDKVQFLKDFPIASNMEMIVYESTPENASFTTPIVNTSNIKMDLDKITDIKGRNISNIIEKAHSNKEISYALVQNGLRPDQKFFSGVLYLPQWHVIVIIYQEISVLSQRENEFVDEMMQDRSNTLEKISIGDTGSVFVIDGKGNIIAGEGPLRTDSIATIHNSNTNNLLIDDIKHVSNGPSVPLVCDPLIEGVMKNNKDIWIMSSRYNKLLEWYVVGFAFKSQIEKPGKILVSQLVVGILLAALVIILISLYFSSRFTRPLSVLAAYAKKIPEQDFTKPIKPSQTLVSLAGTEDYKESNQGNETSHLAQSLLFMEMTLNERIRELVETTSTNERMAGELDAARAIQMGLLPKLMPSFLQGVDELDLHAHLTPAREVGGDLYDFFKLDDEHVCIVMGDVAGKGVPASLFMGITLAMIRSGMTLETDPATFMEKLNNDLSKDNPECMFVTLLLGVLNIKTGEFIYSNGGHNLGVYIAPDGKAEFVNGVSGLMVGGMEDISYSKFSTTMEKDSMLFYYTDGVTEAINGEEELFSDKALLSALQNTQHLTPEEIIKKIYIAVADHVQGEPASDDIAMMCFKFIPDFVNGEEDE